MNESISPVQECFWQWCIKQVYYCDETLANTSQQSTQQRGEKEKEQSGRGPKVWAGRTKPKVGHQGAKEQIMFQSPHHIIPCA
jgi:hypothetical protein